MHYQPTMHFVICGDVYVGYNLCNYIFVSGFEIRYHFALRMYKVSLQAKTHKLSKYKPSIFLYFE